MNTLNQIPIILLSDVAGQELMVGMVDMGAEAGGPLHCGRPGQIAPDVSLPGSSMPSHV